MDGRAVVTLSRRRASHRWKTKTRTQLPGALNIESAVQTFAGRWQAINERQAGRKIALRIAQRAVKPGVQFTRSAETDCARLVFAAQGAQGARQMPAGGLATQPGRFQG